MIKRDSIESVLSTADIQEVVDEFVAMKKRGSNLIGLCPFHDEKTPSFSVSPAKQIYKCFGCGKGGDVISFVMEHEGLTYPESIRWLARKYNIELEEDGQVDPEERNERESLYVALNHAQQYYAQQLMEDEQGRAIGLSYLEERGFRKPIIEKFGLGYSPGGKATFTDYAKKQGFPLETLKKAGITLETDDGTILDRFRERVMFPIHSVSGRVLGFGGRILKTGKKLAKYINTPETEVYHKSKILYGIAQARQAIRNEDGAVLVEGYTDVLTLHQEGIENVAAASGTSLTEDQIKLLKRYSENVTFLFDGDEAGVTASLRGIDLALAGGLNVRTAVLPEGEDPDSFFKGKGAEAGKAYLQEQAEDFIIYKTKLLLKGHEDDPIHRSKVIRDILESIARIPDQIKRSLYVQQTSQHLKVEERVLHLELDKVLRNKLKDRYRKEDAPEAAPQEPLPEDTQEISYSTRRQERHIIRLLLHYGHEMMDEEHTVAEYIFAQVGAMEWDEALCQELIEEYLHLLEEGKSIGLEPFIHHENEELKKLSVDVSVQPYSASKHWKERLGHDLEALNARFKPQVETTLLHLKVKKLLRLIRENQEELKQASDAEEEQELLEIHMQLNQLKQEAAKKLGMVIVK